MERKKEKKMIFAIITSLTAKERKIVGTVKPNKA